MERALRILVLVLVASAHALADDPPARPTTYVEHVAPILEQSCTYCHDAADPSGGLDLSSYAGLLQGGGSGAVIAPGDPGGSRLLRLVLRQEKPAMPADGSELAPDAIATLRRWIAEGALEVAGGPAPPRARSPGLSLGPAASRAPVSSALPLALPLGGVPVPARAASVLAMATSPVAPLLAVAGHGAVLLHDARTDALVGTLPFAPGQIHALRFSRDGRLLLAAGGEGASRGRVVLYDVASGLPTLERDETRDALLAADLRDDLAQLAVGGPTRAVDVREPASGALVFRVEVHTDWVTALGYSPDGVLLATADRAGGVHLWETDSGREYLDLEGHGAAVTALAWRGDGDVLATAATSGHVRLFAAQDGKKIKEWEAHPGGALAVVFLPDGRLVSTGRDRSVAIWAADGREERRLGPLPDAGLCIAVTHDGARLFAGDWTGRVHAWSLPLAAPGRPPKPAPPGSSWTARPIDVADRRAEAERLLADAGAAHERALRALDELRPSAETVDRDARRRVATATAAVTSASESEARARQAATRWALEAELTARHAALRVALEAVNAADSAARAAREVRLAAEDRSGAADVEARRALASLERSRAATLARLAPAQRALTQRLARARALEASRDADSARIAPLAAAIGAAEAEVAALPGGPARSRAAVGVDRLRRELAAARELLDEELTSWAEATHELATTREELARIAADPALDTARLAASRATLDREACNALVLTARADEARADADARRAAVEHDLCASAFAETRSRLDPLR